MWFFSLVNTTAWCWPGTCSSLRPSRMEMPSRWRPGLQQRFGPIGWSIGLRTRETAFRDRRMPERVGENVAVRPSLRRTRGAPPSGNFGVIAKLKLPTLLGRRAGQCVSEELVYVLRLLNTVGTPSGNGTRRFQLVTSSCGAKNSLTTSLFQLVDRTSPHGKNSSLHTVVTSSIPRHTSR